MISIMARSTAQKAAYAATAGFALTILLQILPSIGVLPVTMAGGGSQYILTTSLRLTSVAAANVLALGAYVVRRRAALSASGQPGWPNNS